MRFRDSNLEGIELVNPPLDYDGVLLEKSGRVVGLWSSFAYENGRELAQDNRGVPIDLVDDMLKRVQTGSPLHSLESSSLTYLPPSSPVLPEQSERRLVVIAAEPAVERRLEQPPAARQREQGQRRAKLERIDRAKHRFGVGLIEILQSADSGTEPFAEQRVGEIGPRFIERSDRYRFSPWRYGRGPQAGGDEPHPVAALAAPPGISARADLYVPCWAVTNRSS